MDRKTKWLSKTAFRLEHLASGHCSYADRLTVIKRIVEMGDNEVSNVLCFLHDFVKHVQDDRSVSLRTTAVAMAAAHAMSQTEPLHMPTAIRSPDHEDPGK